MMTWILAAACVLLVLGYWPLFRLAVRRAHQLLDETSLGMLRKCRADAEQLVAQHKQDLEAFGAQVETARLEAQDARDHKSRYFLKIAEIEQEMTTWKNLYQEQSIGHGNAQAMMMRTIEHLGSLLKKHGVKFELPRALNAVRADFEEEHAAPAREAVKLASQEQPKLPAST